MDATASPLGDFFPLPSPVVRKSPQGGQTRALPNLDLRWHALPFFLGCPALGRCRPTPTPRTSESHSRHGVSAWISVWLLPLCSLPFSPVCRLSAKGSSATTRKAAPCGLIPPGGYLGRPTLPRRICRALHGAQRAAGEPCWPQYNAACGRSRRRNPAYGGLCR